MWVTLSAAASFVILPLVKWITIFKPILRRLQLSVDAKILARREAERLKLVAKRTSNAVIVADVTAQVSARRVLDEKIRLLEEAERIAQMGHWSFDPKTEKITWSDQLFVLYGWDKTRGTPSVEEYYQLVTPESGEKLRATRSLLMSGQEMPRMRIETTGTPKRWLEIMGRSELDDEGNVVEIYGTVRDMTDQVRTQMALDEKVARLETAERTANMGHWSFNLKNRRSEWSDQMFQLFNRPSTDRAPSLQEFERLFSAQSATLLREVIQASIGGEVVEPVRLQTSESGDAEDLRWVELRVHASRNGVGDACEVHGTCRDISEQVRRESQLTALIEELRVRKLALDQYAIVTETDVDGCITKANDNFCQISGYARKELIGRNHRIINSGYHPRAFWSDMYEVLATRGVWRGEICNRARNGTIYWVDTINMALKDQCGRIQKYVSVQFDATPRKSAQEQVQRSERELREMNDALPVMVWVVGVDAKCTFVNRAWTEFTGRSLSANLGHGWVDCIHPEDRERTHMQFMDAFGRREPFEFEYRVRRSDGEYRWIRDQGTPRIGPDGEFKGYVGGCVDVTVQRNAAEIVRRNEAELREMSDGLPLLVWMSDAQKRVNFVNRRAGEFPGRSIGANLVQEWISGVFADDVSKCADVYHEAFSARLPFEMEYRIQVKDGGYRWMLDRGVPRFSEEGELTGYVGGCIDVTARKHAESALVRSREEAESAARSKSEFLANMSHEIRTPMTAILGYTDLLAENGDLSLSPRERNKYVHTIKRNGEHLLTIINDILDLSKIQAGKMTVEKLPVAVAQIVQDVVSLMRVRADAKDLKLDVACDGPIPETIECDPVRLRQVLVNLVGNGIKFTEVGGVTIRVSYAPNDTSDSTLSITVEDTGVGMSEQQIEGLFAAFQQADTSTTRRFGGTGLGLMISMRLAELMGGDIRAESAVGRGSKMTISLGVAQRDVPMLSAERFLASAKMSEEFSDRSGPAPGANPDSASTTPLVGLRILLVEDGPDNQRLIAFHLRKCGAEVLLADNGRIAVEGLTINGEVHGTLRSPPPVDVILMDMQMPEMDGYEATRLLRSKGCDLPIIALTAHAMEGDRQKCVDAGCDDYMTKPIDRRRLVDICIDALARQSTSA